MMWISAYQWAAGMKGAFSVITQNWNEPPSYETYEHWHTDASVINKTALSEWGCFVLDAYKKRAKKWLFLS